MTSEQLAVRDFHTKMGRTDLNASKPNLPDQVVSTLRLALILEEYTELRESVDKKDIVGVADALGDLLYVVYGAAVTFGIDLEPVFNEIHRSNMTKEGAQAREDGKILKGPNYTPPNLKPILDAQMQ